MKNKLKNYFWFAPAVIAILGFLWWYISHDDNGVAGLVETGGFVIFYDADSGGVKRVEMDPASTHIFKNPDGAKYLLQPECPGQSTSIYDINGIRLKEVLLAGRQIETSDPDYVLIQKTFEENKEPWEMTYDYGLVLTKAENQVQEDSTENTHSAKIIMWGKSKLAAYDKDENKIYEELFFGQNLNIEKVLPCAGPKIVVFTSEYEYPQEYDPDWEYYVTNRRISFSVIDYHQKSNDFRLDINDVNLQDVNDFEFNFEDVQWPIYYGTKLVSIEEFSDIDAASSPDKTYAAGIINNSLVFLINVEAGKKVFTKPLIKSVNGNINSKVLRIEISNSGVVRVIRHYTGNDDLLVDGIYNSAN